MAQTSAITQALKRTLKQHGKRYTDVAKALDISEASVKRLFAEQSFSLKRLDLICQMLGIEISDLITHMHDRQKIEALNREQEQELASDLPLLLVANSVLNRWTYEDILTHYQFSEPELIRYLAKLDRLHLIELLPGNRIKVLVDRDFHWLPNGPINQFFLSCVKEEFFESRFNQPGEKQQFMVGMLSRQSNAIVQRKLDKLAEEFHTLHYEDEKLPRAEKFGTTVVVGMRVWEPKVFERLRRMPDQRKF